MDYSVEMLLEALAWFFESNYAEGYRSQLATAKGYYELSDSCHAKFLDHCTFSSKLTPDGKVIHIYDDIVGEGKTAPEAIFNAVVTAYNTLKESQYDVSEN